MILTGRYHVYSLVILLRIPAENSDVGRRNDQYVGVRADGRGARVPDERNAVQVRADWRIGRFGCSQRRSAREDAQVGPVRLAKPQVQVRHSGARGRR